MWKFCCNHVNKALGQSQGFIFVIMVDPGINFCDEYYSVMGFCAFKRVRFTNRIKNTNEEKTHLSVNPNLHLNNE